MKKLLLLLLCVPLIGFGQACQYGSSTDASELCDFYKNRSFATYKNADIALDKILAVTGMSKRFVLKECNGISNCLATTYKGDRYILYDRDFMDAIATRTNSWSSISILAHEIGHHVNGHTLGGESTLSESRQMELEADEYSGFVMYKLGATLYQAQEAVRLICTNDDDTYSTHPKLDKRLAAIEKGYNNSKIFSASTEKEIKRSYITFESYLPNKEITFPKIEYDFGKLRVRAKSILELDMLIATLKDNPNVVIELIVYTNYSAKGESHSLTQQRTQVIRSYLEAKGINPKRIIKQTNK